ncbi:tRNA-splicing endonuclease subunit Sen2 isoform X2 [Thrips palmi]|nr:tRNA-splicing endonuclease subunit Sen2 isoform X2 [Thrips palmi]
MISVLKEPRQKRHSNHQSGNPLPVLVESVTGIPAHLAVWKSFTGRFNHDCVEVTEAEDISTLYNMGFFGKGSLSRGCPRPGRRVQFPETIRERQWLRRREWSSLQNLGSSNTLLKHEDPTLAQQAEVIVIADADTEGEDFISNLRPRLEKDHDSLPEVLNLLLEESLFLSYGLGCLYISDIYGQKNYSIVEFWNICLESDVKFLQRYIAYHHFRSKGWIVKCGLKFGGDYLLYKDGPIFYHASYIVLTKVIYGENALETGDLNEKKMDWVTLMGLNRLAETSGKEVLLCYIVWPADVLPNQSSPSIIKKFKIHEVLLQRWQSSVARIGLDEKQETKDNVCS